MVKKYGFISIAITMAMSSCQFSPSTVEVSGRFVGHQDDQVYLELISFQNDAIIDTVKLDQQGNYTFNIENVAETPSLYNIVYNQERIPLLLEAGDNVTVESVGSIIRNYVVEGSEESELLKKFYQPYIAGAQTLNKIATSYANSELSDSERKKLAKEYTNEYYRLRREQLKFIIEFKDHIAAVYAMYQRFPGDQNLFNGDSDVVYYRTVAEAIEAKYPKSPYLSLLKGDISNMEARMRLASKITESSFPDLEIPDMYGKSQKLSSLKGKVILLDFWSTELGNSNVINADLKLLYDKYKDSKVPFEVYQVAIDISKSLWITAVQEQELPWISVSDLNGQNSSALTMYNVQKIPSNFLIDKDGNIVARNVYGGVLEQELIKLTK